MGNLDLAEGSRVFALWMYGFAILAPWVIL